jgi:DNA-binding transcriptional ArsR family regulator
MVLDKKHIKMKAQEVRAINHKIRQNILYFLGEGRKTVTEILIHLRTEQSVASQHLAILKRNGFVESSREGKYIYYSITDKVLKYAE